MAATKAMTMRTRMKTTNKFLIAAFLALLATPALAAQSCPAFYDQPELGHALKGIDLFDGTPEEMASLVPDVNEYPKLQRWKLVKLPQGRRYHLMCRYADTEAVKVFVVAKKAKTCVQAMKRGAFSVVCK